MIANRYPAVNHFALVPQLAGEMDPVLAALDHLLEDDTLFARVKQDLPRRRPQSATRGRHATRVAVILCMLVVRRLYDWSYEETKHFVADRLVLRRFCRIYLERVPDYTTLIRWAASRCRTLRTRANSRDAATGAAGMLVHVLAAAIVHGAAPCC